MSLNTLEPKDPNDTVDYHVNWTRTLTRMGDTIQSSTWPVIDAGITIGSAPPYLPSNTSMVATAWFSGGTAGTTYRATNRIVTTGGRTLDRTIEIRVMDR